MAAVVVATAVVVPPPARAADPAAEWTLMAYLRTAGGLHETAADYLAQWESAAGRSGLHLVVQVEDRQEARRAWRGRLGVGRSLQAVPLPAGRDMGSAEALADFLAWTQQEAPAERRMLLVLAHGVLPAAPEPAGGMRVGAVSEAVNVSRTPQLDILSMDCCYAGSVHAAQELAGAARYLLAPPGELYAPGLPWAEIVEAIGQQPEMTGRELALVALARTREWYRDQPQVATGLVAVDLARVEPLSEALAGLIEICRPRLGEWTAQIAFARAQARLGPQVPMVDLQGFVEALGELTTSSELAAQAQTVGWASRAATVAAWAQGPAQDRYRGLGLWFPWELAPGPGWLEEEQLRWEAQWRYFLTAYLHSLAALAELVPAAGPGAA